MAVLRAEDVEILQRRMTGRTKNVTEQLEPQLNRANSGVISVEIGGTVWGEPLSRVVTALLNPESAMLGEGLCPLTVAK